MPPSIIPIPDIFQARRVLCVQPHYDDNDIGAGGTLALLAEAGAELIYLTATDDLMGVVDASMPNEVAAEMLKRDQFAAGKIIGVKEFDWLGFPDAGKYDYFDLRAGILTAIRRYRPDFIFTADPWLAYEAHRDHIQTGLAAAEAAILYGLTKIPGRDPEIDRAYQPHHIQGVAFYFTREPNTVIDVASVKAKKEAALRCYQAQFDPDGLDELVSGLTLKEQQFAFGHGFTYGEGLKVLNTASLHCGL